MSDLAIDGINLTKDYYKYFLPTDLQWTVTKIDEDFTLYDLFRLAHQANVVLPGIPASFGMIHFSEFWKQINLPREKDDTDEVKYLELYWHLDYDIRETKKTGKPTDQPNIRIIEDDVNNYWDDHMIGTTQNLMSFHGMDYGCLMKSCETHECDDDCPKETAYGIEFSPLNNLKHLPIRILPTINFYPPFIESDFELKPTNFKLTIRPTLYCFITSIFWELTFVCNTPDKIANKSQEICDMMEEFDSESEDE